jgi:hypothetical protein
VAQGVDHRVVGGRGILAGEAVEDQMLESLGVGVASPGLSIDEPEEALTSGSEEVVTTVERRVVQGRDVGGALQYGRERLPGVGAPRGWVVWVGFEGERLLICTDDSTWKAKDMRRDPRVALSVVDSTNPYRMAAIQGRVVEVRLDAEGSFMDPIAMKYTSAPFPYRGPGRVCFVFEVTHAGTRSLDWLSHKPQSADGDA